jgi:hypothetical protein
MLRVNVGINRKLTKDFNSTGFSVNLEGEVNAPLDEPETVIEKIREYYDLADEALRDQIERYESDSAIADRDAPSNGRWSATKSNGTKSHDTSVACVSTIPVAMPAVMSTNGPTSRPEEAARNDTEKATNKQVQFLLSLAKRQGMTLRTLEDRTADVFGRRVGTYELTKRQAGQLIEALNSVASATATS